MGRWAQRQRAGGGPPIGGPLAEIVSANILTVNEIAVAWAVDVDPGDLTATDFTSNPSGEVADSMFPLSSTSFQVQFLLAIDTDASVTYTGSAPGLKSPDTEPYT